MTLLCPCTGFASWAQKDATEVYQVVGSRGHAATSGQGGGTVTGPKLSQEVEPLFSTTIQCLVPHSGCQGEKQALHPAALCLSPHCRSHLDPSVFPVSQAE